MYRRKNKIKYVLFIIFGTLAIIFIWYKYSWYHPELYIKDFESVSDDYQKVVSSLYEYYDENDFSENIVIDIDNEKNFISHKDTEIELDEDEKQSLINICKNSYTGYYNYVWVSKNEVVFWNDETKTYGILYSKDFVETKKSIEKWYKEIEFKRINSNWYEIGRFGI